MLLHHSQKFCLWHDIRKLESISSNTSALAVVPRWLSPCRFQRSGGICPQWALLTFVLAGALCQDLVLHYLTQLGLYLCLVFMERQLLVCYSANFSLAEPAEFYMSISSSWLWHLKDPKYLSVCPEPFMQVVLKDS